MNLVYKLIFKNINFVGCYVSKLIYLNNFEILIMMQVLGFEIQLLFYCEFDFLTF